MTTAVREAHKEVRERVSVALQWNLRIMEPLRPGILSFIERLSSLQRLKMYWYNTKVNCWDRIEYKKT